METTSPGPDLSLYVYVGLIGSGGFGNVTKHQLQDEWLEAKDVPKMLAVKKLLAGCQLREIKMCDFSHKNIVTFLGVEEIEGTIHIKMEAAKYNLKQFQLDINHGKFDGFDFLHLALHISEGLEYLHQQGWAHRDVKPQNILVFWPQSDPNPPVNTVTLKLCDFGLSRFVPEGTATATAVGTLPYMAPEVRRPFLNNSTFHGDYQKADVFSCGLVFFELLLGELPERPEQEDGSKERISYKKNCVSLKEEYSVLLLAMLAFDRIERISAQCVVAMVRPWFRELKLLEQAERSLKEMHDQQLHIKELRSENVLLRERISEMQPMRRMRRSVTQTMSLSKKCMQKLMEVLLPKPIRKNIYSSYESARMHTLEIVDKAMKLLWKLMDIGFIVESIGVLIAMIVVGYLIFAFICSIPAVLLRNWSLMLTSIALGTALGPFVPEVLIKVIMTAPAPLLSLSIVRETFAQLRPLDDFGYMINLLLPLLTSRDNAAADWIARTVVVMFVYASFHINFNRRSVAAHQDMTNIAIGETMPLVSK